MNNPGLLLIILGLWTAPGFSFAQKFAATEGYISFYSSAPLEDIKAENRKITSLFNSTTGDIAFSVPINQFQFEKKLMQEHFNEKYMESDKYPRSTFSGKVYSYDPSASSPQNVVAKGKMTIHGVVRDVEIPGTIENKNGMLLMKSKFMVRLADYDIKIPKLMWQNITEQVEVTVELTYKPQ